MKGLLRVYVYHVVALLLFREVFAPAIEIKEGLVGVLVGAGVLMLLQVLLKPILKLLFFPLNALTFGLFSLVINSAIFYLFYRLTPALSITAWKFSGFVIGGFKIPEISFNFWLTIFIAGLFVSVLTNFLTYLND
ncbi:MAG: phage holin family protein [Patescibacteria group bacterium]